MMPIKMNAAIRIHPLCLSLFIISKISFIQRCKGEKKKIAHKEIIKGAIGQINGFMLN